jgi:phosphoribosylaminoimidazole-succinocarboxamide synthase
MTPEVVAGITERYIELFEAVTGEKFVREESENVEARIERNVAEYLKSL